ncbi:HYDIN protein, partial [Vireo altiloquus]|nr:HYDIN protein [Vireo altiloquus]
TLEVGFQSAHQFLAGEVDDVLLSIRAPQLLGQAAGWAQQQMSPAPSAEFSLFLQVTKGPTFHICLRAKVLALSLDLSKDRLQFSGVLVGQWQAETVRLYSCFRVACKWFLTVIKAEVKHRII